ncbi:MBL fold metallo-hydrolase [Halapricum desulfuricans]|uniref:Zn-dependent hydrolase of the beta-lactamase fold n=1 Tax=Halapricum desulfuricans TaxID=2841257 RepID=A0A897N5X6_9EURY|nr:MBL fold metallo-hydrolase [Halapricum desulfuricans]QSG07881.1 Zn-dependent hydrolase of the beta-lactamase fold [Halapricum desulfuricans]
MPVTHDGLTIEWLGYATVRLESKDGTVVYLDPGRYGVLTGDWEPDTPGVAHPPSRDYRPEDGDIVCVTHVHHYDPDGIDRVADEDATVIAFEGMDVRGSRRDLPRLADLEYEVRTVDAESDLVVAGVPIWTLPAYNEPDGPHTRPDGSPFHPEGRGCGFLLSIDGTRVCWPGDTDVLDGHAELEVDVFLPPIGGAFTMDRSEAATLAVELDPELVVPIHYNTFAALETDHEAFASELDDADVSVALDT